ncbi:hypothetical protein [Sporosarcina sp.]|uniref:hypothetical protein n=1 Tax=Sporosarcina sp. TaxID=49982 RepID=UPI00260A4B31|nr:hypothetical protein [Sporosarcina sp.]
MKKLSQAVVRQNGTRTFYGWIRWISHRVDIQNVLMNRLVRHGFPHKRPLG